MCGIRPTWNIREVERVFHWDWDWHRGGNRDGDGAPTVRASVARRMPMIGEC